MKLNKTLLVLSSLFLLSGCSVGNEGGVSSSAPSSSLGGQTSSGEEASSSEYSSRGDSSSLMNGCTIVFDLDGGTSPSYQGEVKLDAWSITSFFFDCSKEGYHFRGWSYESKQVFDEDGNLLFTPELASRMVFKAIFRQDVRVKINVTPSETGEATGEGYYPYSSSISLSASAKEGYLFDGWYDGEGILLSSKASYSYKAGEDDIEVEARFKGQPFPLTVSSNSEAHGAVCINPTASTEPGDYLATDTKEISFSSTVKVAAISKSEEVGFLGWYDDLGSLLSENAVYSFTMPKSEYALTAKWDYFGIAYHLNGGVQNPDNPTHLDSSSEAILLAPSRDYYAFEGWYFDEGFTQKAEKIPSGTMDEVHVYAKWSPIAYKISYELNGGSNGENPSGYTVEDEVNLLPASKKGYSFLGWYLDSSFSEEVASLPLGSHGDITLYAKWEVVDYAISYDLGEGGSNGEGNPTSYNVETAVSLSDPTRPGYEFAGWNDGENDVSSIECGRTGDIVLTAKWNPKLNRFTLASEDESKGKASLVSGEGYSGESIQVSAAPEEGYLFRGWYAGETLVSEEASYSFLMPTQDYSLEARFWTNEERLSALRGAHPLFNEDKSKASFGLYPQTRVSDEAIVSALEQKEAESNGWYLLGEEYYAKLEGAPSKEDLTFLDGTQIVTGETYWFKCSPIEWIVNPCSNTSYFLYSDASKGLFTLFSSSILDAYTFGKLGGNYTDLSSWLNSSFSGAAFSFGGEELQESEVPYTFSTQTYVNGKSKILVTKNTYNLEDRTKLPKVFLPLYDEACYSLPSNEKAVATDYAVANGLEYDGSWRYWTSTSGSNNYYSHKCLPTNYVGDTYVNTRKMGIRPGVKVKIS